MPQNLLLDEDYTQQVYQDVEQPSNTSSVTTSTTFGATLVSSADAAAARTALVLGTLATENTPLAVSKGGTGSTTAANARTALGVDDIATNKSKLDATVAPTANEDSGDGYTIGSIWIDVAADQVYMATDVTVGAAVWKQLSA